MQEKTDEPGGTKDRDPASANDKKGKKYYKK